MIVVQRTRRVAIVLLAMMLALTLAVPLMGAKGGNSEGAKACQKGGWETLAPSPSPTVGFGSEEECVAYAAQGGQLVALAFSVQFRTTIVPSGDYQICRLEARATYAGVRLDLIVSSVEHGGATSYSIDHTTAREWTPLISSFASLTDAWRVDVMKLHGSPMPIVGYPLTISCAS